MLNKQTKQHTASRRLKEIDLTQQPTQPSKQPKFSVYGAILPLYYALMVMVVLWALIRGLQAWLE